MCTLEAIARALQYLGEPAELYRMMLAPLHQIVQIQTRFRQHAKAKARALASPAAFSHACLAAPSRAAAVRAGIILRSYCRVYPLRMSGAAPGSALLRQKAAVALQTARECSARIFRTVNRIVLTFTRSFHAHICKAAGHLVARCAPLGRSRSRARKQTTQRRIVCSGSCGHVCAATQPQRAALLRWLRVVIARRMQLGRIGARLRA